MSDVLAGLRLVRAGWILAREGVAEAVPTDTLQGLPLIAVKCVSLLAKRDAKYRARPERLSRAINRLGPSYVKLGQFLATRPDVVGKAIAADLAHLQDRMETFDQSYAVDAIEQSLGQKVDLLFDRLDTPIAAASIAQVHPAVVDGQKVAVKVIRPDVRERFARDNESLF